ncbi:hypothetical protein [Flavobacterium yafengii]|uniref:hypothetical protein n=1 Tax=Flavobacterium yafengii TaxID=3041253 RepID=UPI0024A9A3E4|nr:hypothetical protein [Flavobacterium yafengii]MDI6047073.1 hypothetical protein [Flavobacterium yafengii]
MIKSLNLDPIEIQTAIDKESIVVNHQAGTEQAREWVCKHRGVMPIYLFKNGTGRILLLDRNYVLGNKILNQYQFNNSSRLVQILNHERSLFTLINL